MQRES